MHQPVAGEVSSASWRGTGLGPAQRVTLTLPALTEAAVLGALAHRGAHTGTSTAGSAALAVAAPAVGFGVRGAVDVRFAGRHSEPPRLLEELVISGLAAAAPTPPAGTDSALPWPACRRGTTPWSTAPVRDCCRSRRAVPADADRHGRAAGGRPDRQG